MLDEHYVFVVGISGSGGMSVNVIRKNIVYL